MMNWKSAIVVVLLLFCAAAFGVRRLLNDPNMVLLQSDGAAKWIRADVPFFLEFKRADAISAVFVKQIEIPITPVDAVLRVTALRRVVLQLDGRDFFDSGPRLEKWKTTYAVLFPAGISIGKHELRCIVVNWNGPALLRISSTQLDLHSDASWIASDGRVSWRPAALADVPWGPALTPENALHLPSQLLWPLVLGGLFTLILFFGLEKSGNRPLLQSASALRWILLAAWLVLGTNNIFKVPYLCGYDVADHYQYIAYVSDHLALPRPDGGWQFFQSPLFYVTAATLCHLFRVLGVAVISTPILLRVIPLASGALILQVSYRAARMTFPDRGDLQMIATVVGGFMPVNLYMSQTVSNEPMAQAISSLILLIMFGFVQSPQKVLEFKPLAIAGLTLGLALITKINTVVWALPLGLSMAIALRNLKVNWIGWMRAGAIVAFSALAVSGWLFIRNYRLIGKPFFLQASDSPWWQDPGFRTPNTLYEFGRVFTHPILNITGSVWDSVYATCWGTGFPGGTAPWNFDLIACGVWISILPATAVLVGVVRSVLRKDRGNSRTFLRLAAFTLCCFLAAIFYVYLTLPVYCCAKAAYMLGTMPCLGLLAAAGFDKIMINRLRTAVVGGVLACWALTAYLSYFVGI